MRVFVTGIPMQSLAFRVTLRADIRQFTTSNPGARVLVEISRSREEELVLNVTAPSAPAQTHRSRRR